MKKIMKSWGYVSIEVIVIVALVFLGGITGVTTYVNKSKGTTEKTQDAINNTYNSIEGNNSNTNTPTNPSDTYDGEIVFNQKDNNWQAIKDSYSETIQTVSFIKADPSVGEGQAYDITQEQNGKMIAWYNSNDNSLTIKSNAKIVADSDMHALFAFFCEVTSFNFSNFDTSNITNMALMFQGCSSIKSLDLSNFNTKNVLFMSATFLDCDKLSELNLSTFDTKNVIYMKLMFEGCYSLTTLDLSSFDTSNVTTMEDMFDDCNLLETIYVSEKWNTDKVTDSENMFYCCNNLKNYNSSYEDKTKAHYNDGGYLTLKSN